MPPKRKQNQTTAPANGQQTTVVFSKFKISQLKEECTQRGLETTGKKAELVKRLDEYEKLQVGAGGKKMKKEDEEEEDIEGLSMKDKLMKLAEKEKKNKKQSFQVDSCYPGVAKVLDNFDCMLNQTNIGHNNNKFYVIQLLEDGGRYVLWNRWGRVGESGQNARKDFGNDVVAAEKEFKRKFKDKTKNNWDERDNFTPFSGKYTLIEMDAQDETDNQAIIQKLEQLDSVDGSAPAIKTEKKVKPCVLDKPTQALIKLLFDNDMFKEAMAKMNIDVKKMPLGKLSKTQIAKGFEVLEEIEASLKNKSNRKQIEELTSRFYTLIPHSFGRMRPPVIGDQETVTAKFDMLLVLGDIEIAQSLQKVAVKQEEEEEVDHPLDVNYGLLKCGLKHIDTKQEIYKLISEYTANTAAGYRKLELLDLWEVDRQDEDVRFAEHKDLSNRKLLWHGTNIAVVVAILKSGLRIMPHSGGRVGSGIYFASENGKSAAYVGTSGNGTGIMFLNEVALGKQHVIYMDDSSLKKAPGNSDSVLAKGSTEPNPNDDVTIKIEDNDIVVPKGKPITMKNEKNSYFSQSEYLVYKESQCRIRYMLKFKFSY